MQSLSHRYGAALDRRDCAALLSVFDSDASMLVEQPGHAIGTLCGHAELSRLVKIIAHWPRTLHIVSQGVYEVARSTAYGEVGCTAHHFDSVDVSTANDHIMHIVYFDRYLIDRDNQWRIRERRVVVRSTETARGYRGALPNT